MTKNNNFEKVGKKQNMVAKISNTKGKAIEIYLNIDLNNLKTNKSWRQKEPTVKILTKLSVSQLAYFFRVLYKMKKIKAANQTDIMRFIAENFETDNVVDISSKSLRSKYYMIQEKEKSAIRDQLLEIIQFIDKDQKSLNL